MDKKTVFADKLAMPRALKVLDHGVLVGEPPNLWLMKDTDGDLKADTKDLVVNTYGNPNGGIEHNANSLFWAMDNVMYSSEHVWDLRWKNGKFEPLPALSRGQWQVSQDDAGRIYRNVNDSPLFVDYTPSRYFLRNPNGARTRGLYELLIEQTDATVYPGAEQPRRQPRLPRSVLPRRRDRRSSFRAPAAPTIYRGDVYPEGAARQRVHHRLADQPRAPHGGDRRWVGPADGEERLRAGRVPRVVGRTVPSGEPVRRPRRQHVRRRHVPRRRAGRRHLERIPDRLHQVARHGAAGRQGPDLARRVRQRAGAASGAAGAVEGDARSSWCRRCRIRRAGGATRRSGCSSSAATRPSRRR